MMGKLSKRALALFLAGAMAFMPAADVLAADNTDNINLTVTETEDITQESDATETDGSTAETETDSVEEKDSNKDADSNGDNDDATDPDAGNEVVGDNNTDSETGDNKDDNGTGSEAGSIDNSDSGADKETDTDLEDDNADIQDSDIEGGSDIEGDSETEDLDSEADSEQATENGTEEEFPGPLNYALSAKQLEEKKDLADHLDEITGGLEGTDYVNGELVFAASTLAEAEKIADAYGAKLKDFDEGIGVLILPEDVSVSHALTIAAMSKDVVLPPAWPNYIYRTCGDIDEDIDADTYADAPLSDETYISDNAYAEAVKAYSDPYLNPANSRYQYQHVMVGSTYAWNAGYKGKGIKIAILDTGVSSHSDLNVAYNYNASSDSSADDGNGHGTHVAGLAAAKINGNGGTGIAPEASIYNIKVLNSDGSGMGANIIRGVNHAVTQKVDIINMSLGGPGYSGLYDTAITNAYNAGIIVIAAAGNDGSKVKCYPGCYKNSLCVGAVDANKGRTYFSNYGSWVNISAPGLALYSTSKTGDYQVMSGTSQATPIVSGTAAVILSADASIRGKKGAARVNALISKMNKGKISGSGGAAGIVSLAKALNIPVSKAAPKAPTFLQTNKTVNGNSLSVSIKPASTADVVYYSINGKNPTYKNGILDNATKYTAPFTISGSAKITVKAIAVSACGMVSKPVSITYTFKPHATEITVTGQNVLLKGKSTTLKAEVNPSYAVNKKVNWTSSAPSEVSVSAGGKVTATKAAVDGKTYTITATPADKESTAKAVTFKITVKAAATIGSVAFKKGGKVQKSAVITTAYKSYNLAGLLEVTDTKKAAVQNPVNMVVFSSSNTKVAAIDSATPGNIIINGAGKAVITATANDGSGKKATFTFTVQQLVTSVQIKGGSKLAIGRSIKLTATVNKDAANKKLDWSVSPAGQGVTVSNGTVKAAKNAVPGSYAVTAKAKDGGNRGGTMTITVSDVKITKIQLNKKSETIFRVAGNYSSKTSTTITAAITGGDASGIEFTSSNTGVATVTQSGAVATIKAGKVTGTAKITCKAANGKSASCTIKVVNPPSRLAITSKAGFNNYVAIGKKTKLSAVFEEEFGSVSSKKVTWTSTNPAVATVDKSGNVKGKAYGSAYIKATANDGSGLSAQYGINVVNPIKTLTFYGWISGGGKFFKYINYTYVGKEGTVRILYNGSAYTTDSKVCPSVAIEVGNPDVVSVQYAADGYYILYGLKRGSTKITVKALDGTGVSKTYDFEVR